MFQRVLAPVDFSADADAAARLAWRLTNDSGTLTILHADAIPELTSLASEPIYVARRAWMAIKEQHAAEYGRKLEQLVASIVANADGRAGPTIESVVRIGEVVETIVQEARGMTADLMVIGAHGQSGSVRFLFGSVAAKVSRHAPCPVLVTRPGMAREVAERGTFRHVVVAADHSPFTAHCIELGRLLSPADSRLHLLHVWQPPPGLPLQFNGERRNYQINRMQELLERMQLTDSQAEPLVDVGNPAARILAHVEKTGADLIVMGAHSRDNLVDRVLGTTADRILRHANVPVLLVPEAVLSSEERTRARTGRA